MSVNGSSTPLFGCGCCVLCSGCDVILTLYHSRQSNKYWWCLPFWRTASWDTTADIWWGLCYSSWSDWIQPSQFLQCHTCWYYYWIQPATGPPAIQVYCDFNRQCGCDGTHVAFLNMSDPSQDCPSNWTLYSSPVRSCGRGFTGGCSSVTFSTHGLYSRICGRVLGYQNLGTGGFYGIVRLSHSIDQYYLSGVSLTHGSVGSRQHIWSFASARGEGNFSPRLCVTVVVVLTGHTTHHLLEATISVILAIVEGFLISFTLPTLCGMVLGVVPTAPAASSTTLPGSARPSPSPPRWPGGQGMQNIWWRPWHTYSADGNLHTKLNWEYSIKWILI